MRIVTGLPCMPAATCAVRLELLVLATAARRGSGTGTRCGTGRRRSRRSRAPARRSLGQLDVGVAARSRCRRASSRGFVFRRLQLLRARARARPASAGTRRAPTRSGLTMTTSLRRRRRSAARPRGSAARALCVPTTAGMLRLRATIAVCDVTPPRSVRKRAKWWLLELDHVGRREVVRDEDRAAPRRPAAAACRGLPSSAFSTRSTDLHDVGLALAQVRVLDLVELLDQHVHLLRQRPLGVAALLGDDLAAAPRDSVGSVRIIAVHVEERAELGRRVAGGHRAVQLFELRAALRAIACVEARDLGLDLLAARSCSARLRASRARRAARGRWRCRPRRRCRAGEAQPIDVLVGASALGVTGLRRSSRRSARRARRIASASSAPSVSSVTFAPLPAASIITPMMLLALTLRPLRDSQTSLWYFAASCVSLADARACRPELVDDFDFALLHSTGSDVRCAARRRSRREIAFFIMRVHAARCDR